MWEDWQKQPHDKYIMLGAADRNTSKVYHGACYAQAFTVVFPGCEIFWDNSTPGCIGPKQPMRDACVKRDKHSEADLAFIKWLVHESIWQDIFAVKCEDVVKYGGCYNTNFPNKLVLQAAYHLRDVSEQPERIKYWYELASKGYNKLVAYLLAQYAPGSGYHTSTRLNQIGKSGVLAMLNNDRTGHKDNKPMSDGKVEYNSLHLLWSKGDDIKYPDTNTSGEWRSSYYDYTKNPENSMEEMCKLNGWPLYE